MDQTRPPDLTADAILLRLAASPTGTCAVAELQQHFARSRDGVPDVVTLHTLLAELVYEGLVREVPLAPERTDYLITDQGRARVGLGEA